MTQLSIAFDTPPRIKSSPTSVAAAERVKPHLGAMQMRVLEYIRTHQDCTDNEICAGVNSPNGGRARRIELYKAGLIAKSGVRGGSTTWKVV
jgi:hypothetical protein